VHDTPLVDIAAEAPSALGMDIDLEASLWVMGVFVASMLALRVAERLAHTRARNRTRLAIEATRERSQKISKNTEDERAAR
jgi:hypothetical protein